MNNFLDSIPLPEELTSLLSWIVPALLLFLLGFIYWRTQSGYLILGFLWDKLLRGKKSSDQAIQQFDQEQYEINRFIYHYRIRISTFPQINTVINWVNHHQISVTELRKASSRFDVDTLSFHRDSRIKIAMKFLCMLCCYFIILFSLRLIATDVAWYNFTETGHSFILTNDFAAESRLFNLVDSTNKYTWYLDKPLCQRFSQFEDNANFEKLKQKSALTDSEIKTLCSSLGNTSARVQQTIRTQKWMGSVLLIVSTFFLLYILFDMISSGRARRLSKKCQQRSENHADMAP